MRSLSSKLILCCLTLTLFGSLQAQGGSYPTWKHELQDMLGLEQTGKAARATFEALVAYLTDLDLMDEQVQKGYDGMGGYVGFQIYLDNNKTWILDMLRYSLSHEWPAKNVSSNFFHLTLEDCTSCPVLKFFLR